MSKDKRHKKFASLAVRCRGLAEEMLVLANETVQDEAEPAKVRQRALQLSGITAGLLAVAKMTNTIAKM